MGAASGGLERPADPIAQALDVPGQGPAPVGGPPPALADELVAVLLLPHHLAGRRPSRDPLVVLGLAVDLPDDPVVGPAEVAGCDPVQESSTRNCITGAGSPARAIVTRLADSAADWERPSANSTTLRRVSTPERREAASTTLSSSARVTPRRIAWSIAMTPHVNWTPRARSAAVRARDVTRTPPTSVTSSSVRGATWTWYPDRLRPRAGGGTVRWTSPGSLSETDSPCAIAAVTWDSATDVPWRIRMPRARARWASLPDSSRGSP